MKYSIKTFSEKNHVQEAIEFHVENGIPFTENIFRMGSKEYFEFFIEARRMSFNGELNNISTMDQEVVKGDLGKFDFYEGEEFSYKFEFNKREGFSLVVTYDDADGFLGDIESAIVDGGSD